MKVFLIFISLCFLSACGGGGGSEPNSNITNITAGPVESELGDFCLASESYYEFSEDLSSEPNVEMRIPAPGDNKRMVGERTIQTASESSLEERDYTITYYAVNNPSDIVTGDQPPFSNSGYWYDWDSDHIFTARWESNIDGETSSSVYFYDNLFGRQLVRRNSSNNVYAQLISFSGGDYWVWAMPDIPAFDRFSSNTTNYVELSATNYSEISDGLVTVAVDTTKIIKTGIGCVEAMKVITNDTLIARAGSGISAFAEDLTNSGPPEKITVDKTDYVHPVLGKVRTEQTIKVYQDDTDNEPIGIGQNRVVLFETNVAYLLPDKTG